MGGDHPSMAVRGRTRRIGLTGLVAVVLCTACPREAEEVPCPDLAEGDLVITELRGPQDGNDSFGQWIELFNAGDTEADLLGLRVDIVPLDGRDPTIVLVRNEDVFVAPNEYVVLGNHNDNNLPEYVDYGWALTSSSRDLFQNAFIEVSACDVLVDRMLYRGLPTVGTLSLDPSFEPSAKRNDDETAYCVDAADAPPGEVTGFGQPGTPGEENRPCEP